MPNPPWLMNFGFFKQSMGTSGAGALLSHNLLQDIRLKVARSFWNFEVHTDGVTSGSGACSREGSQVGRMVTL